MRFVQDYVRSEKAKAIELHHGIVKRECLDAVHVENGMILPLKVFPEDGLLFGRGGCVDEEGVYIEASGIPKRISGCYDTEVEEVIDERVVYCGYLVGHWGHFLVEGITRLWYALDHDKECDGYVFFVGYGEETVLKGNYREFFRLLGIDERIRVINRPTRFSNIVIPESAYHRTINFADEWNRLLNAVCDRALQECCDSYPEKVFLSRSRFIAAQKVPSEFGLNMLDEYFSKNGYTVLYPEEMALPDLICYLQSARVCASESGSCAHNLLFARAGSQIEIIERQSYINEIQANIDVIKDFDVTYIDAYYCLYFTNAAGGPYCIYYTKWMERFTKDRHYSTPSSAYLSETYKRICFDWYVHAYYAKNGCKLYICDGNRVYINVYLEAIEESNEHFKDVFLATPYLAQSSIKTIACLLFQELVVRLCRKLKYI